MPLLTDPRSNSACLAIAAFSTFLPAFRQDEPKAAPAAGGGVRVVPTVTLGATSKTLQFLDLGATPDGKRTQFDPVPEGTAFEVWFDQAMPRKVEVDEPDPEKPGATRKVVKDVVSVLRVPDAEWDEYYGFLNRDAPEGDKSVFKQVILNELLEQKMTLLIHRDVLPDVERRAAAALEKLENGAAWKDVVRVHTEDDVGRQADGLFAEGPRGSMLNIYPFAKVLFELEVNQATGPVYNKHAAYVTRVERFERSNSTWFDKARASGVCIRYTNGPGLSARAQSALKLRFRVRTAQDRFRTLIPPAIQVPPPKTFGPDDIAPVGQPDAPLKRSNDDK